MEMQDYRRGKTGSKAGREPVAWGFNISRGAGGVRNRAADPDKTKAYDGKILDGDRRRTDAADR